MAVWRLDRLTRSLKHLIEIIGKLEELEKLSPVPDDDLQRAAELLQKFSEHWERLKGQPEDQHALIKLIVLRVYIEDEPIKAMTPQSNYHLVLGHKRNGPTEYTVDPLLSTCGSDGIGHVGG